MASRLVSRQSTRTESSAVTMLPLSELHISGGIFRECSYDYMLMSALCCLQTWRTTRSSSNRTTRQLTTAARSSWCWIFPGRSVRSEWTARAVASSASTLATAPISLGSSGTLHFTVMGKALESAYWSDSTSYSCRCIHVDHLTSDLVASEDAWRQRPRILESVAPGRHRRARAPRTGRVRVARCLRRVLVVAVHCRSRRGRGRRRAEVCVLTQKVRCLETINERKSVRPHCTTVHRHAPGLP